MIRRNNIKVLVCFIIIIFFAFAFFQVEEKSEDILQIKEKVEEIVESGKDSTTETDNEEIKIQQPIRDEKDFVTEKIKETEEEKENDEVKKLKCTLSVECDEIIKNIEMLNPEKLALIPSDGTIFAEETVIFYEGESVFNLLVREMKKNKIQLEFVNTPIYSSAYIEGISNIYEKDCGENSGWIYLVNGKSPNYGCSNYKLNEGDVVEWVYYCN